jgi:hypothetical protein
MCYEGIVLTTFLLVRELKAAAHWTILCAHCGRNSWHPQDVMQCYCGCCHRFHEGALVTRVDRQPVTEADA